MSDFFKYFKTGIAREMPSDQIDGTAKPANIKGAIKTLFPYMRPHWRVGIPGAVLVILSSLLVFPQPLINRFLVDDVILAKRLDLLPWAILLLGGVRLIILGTGMLQQYFMADFEQSVIIDVQKALLEHTLQLPKAFFDKEEIGYLISRISSDIQGLRWFFADTFVYLFTNLIKFLGGLAFLFYLEWRMALACLVVLPALVVSMRYFSRRMYTLSHHDMEQHASILKRLQETIVSMPLIKAFSTERRESERVMDAFEGERQIRMEESVVGSVAGTVINTVPDLAKAVVLIVGAYLAIQGEWTLGSLLAFQSYLSYVFGPALFFANANLTLQRSLAALERVMGLFELVPEENLETGIQVERIKGEIAFENVSFSYGGDEPVLQELSFQVKAGEHVAIVGPSGVGKTTLVSLMLCFYQPTSGEICFDGLPASDYNLPSLRKRIGYVSQSSLLLSGTFSENLRYGREDATREDVERAAKAAGIHDFIVSLPQGYDSHVDERGVNLSEGQKQRLAIARSLVKDPDILILDEPTSALDSIVERSIFEALPAYVQDKTLFVVAHRLATIQDSDRILLLNERQLVAIGTHRELLATNTFYQELVANQQLIRLIDGD